MGPDGVSRGYPDSPAPGLKNNAYTNIMAVWVLWRALEVLDLLPDMRRRRSWRQLGLSEEEIVRWDEISHRMYVPFHDDGIISQFEATKARRVGLGEVSHAVRQHRRLELILEAENDSANRSRHRNRRIP